MLLADQFGGILEEGEFVRPTQDGRRDVRLERRRVRLPTVSRSGASLHSTYDSLPWVTYALTFESRLMAYLGYKTERFDPRGGPNHGEDER